MDPALVGLEPEELWRQFDALCRIPRPSRKEDGVRAYLIGLAERQGWEAITDTAGNIVVRTPGRGRGVDRPPLAIQGHMDMVCEKLGEVEHDFERDPIRLRRAVRKLGGREREVLQAQGTTLGSDNGIGCAAALALALTPGLEHPPLELLFTADEELGMTGAFDLDPSLLSARRLINLDAELEGRIYLSCAGGRELHAVWELDRDDRHLDDVALRVSVEGLRGGHSGVDIHEGRANAIALLIALLTAKEVELEGVRLASCEGGGRVNAIAREAEAVLWCGRARAKQLTRELETAASRITASLARVDPELSVTVAELPDPDAAPAPVSAITSRAIIEALRNQRDGVLAWSPVIPGLVETSNNLGTLTTVSAEHGDEIRLIAMARSSKAGALESFQERCERTLEASGAQIEYKHAFPGWEAKLDTELLRTALASYAALFGHEPKIEAIHAGLECGILHDRVPGLEMIAFGPDIYDAHTPSESLALDTVEPFWRFLVRLVSDLI
ncbi:MAG: beta-Ala-His dipeptidase [Enhygromyxa sp.]